MSRSQASRSLQKILFTWYDRDTPIRDGISYLTSLQTNFQYPMPFHHRNTSENFRRVIETSVWIIKKNRHRVYKHIQSSLTTTALIRCKKLCGPRKHFTRRRLVTEAPESTNRRQMQRPDTSHLIQQGAVMNSDERSTLGGPKGMPKHPLFRSQMESGYLAQGFGIHDLPQMAPHG